ncbi:MAG: hypothetical protein RLZZ15_2327, partial [Verrucomicrobiota bacterium]
MDSGPANGRGATSRLAARIVTWLLIAAVVGFDVWTIRSSRKIWNFGEPQKDYYNLLVDGFQDGHLHMKAEVPAALLNAPDPYDPAKRPPGIALHDASLYRGKYYLYFGVVPAVTLLLPFTAITGVDLPLQLGVLLFVLGGIAISLATWRAVRRRYFADATPWLDPMAVLALGVTSMGPVLLRRASVWEFPISSGYFFAMAGLACVYGAIHATRRQRWWLAGAGLALGLAVGSRPTYFFATTALAVPLLWWWWRERAAGGGRWWPTKDWWTRLACAVAPLALIGAGLAWYNYARFGNPFEFGVSYELSGVYEGKMRHFSATYVPLNFHRYFWAPWQLRDTFPFIAIEPVGTAPEGYYIGDDLFGVWRTVPFTWLGLVALAAAWRPGKGDGLAVWTVSTGALFAGVAGFIVFFYSAMGRYLLDFCPALAWLACVGTAVLEQRLRGPLRLVARIFWVATLAVSVVFALLFSLSFNREFRERNAESHRAVARWFNHGPEWIARATGNGYGPMALDVRLANLRTGSDLNLITTGTGTRRDRVFVRALAGGQMQIGFAHGEHDVRLSRPLAAELGRTHRLRAEMGSLFPPEDFPTAARWDALPGTSPLRRLRIEWDGEPVLAGRQMFFPASPGTVAIDTKSVVQTRREGLDAAGTSGTDVMNWRARARLSATPGTSL